MLLKIVSRPHVTLLRSIWDFNKLLALILFYMLLKIVSRPHVTLLRSIWLNIFLIFLFWNILVLTLELERFCLSCKFFGAFLKLVGLKSTLMELLKVFLVLQLVEGNHMEYMDIFSVFFNIQHAFYTEVIAVVFMIEYW